MADPVVSASVTRGELSLPDLNLNDHVAYIVSGGDLVFGATVTWRRQQVQSPFVDSKITTGRVLDIVQDKFAVDVMGPDHVTMASNVQALINAFSQSYFNLTVQFDAQPYTYACEASDYTMDWTVPRMYGLRTQVKFNLLRSPTALNGV